MAYPAWILASAWSLPSITHKTSLRSAVGGLKWSKVLLIMPAVYWSGMHPAQAGRTWLSSHLYSLPVTTQALSAWAQTCHKAQVLSDSFRSASLGFQCVAAAAHVSSFKELYWEQNTDHWLQSALLSVRATMSSVTPSAFSAKPRKDIHGQCPIQQSRKRTYEAGQDHAARPTNQISGT